jgi:hypothetical protein
MTFTALMEAVDKATVAAGKDAAYHAALRLVRRIDSDLERGTGHYRTTDGLLLATLDQVVNAIIANNLETTR